VRSRRRERLASINAYVDAGFDGVHIQQLGGAGEGFLEFYAGQVPPRLRDR